MKHEDAAVLGCPYGTSRSLRVVSGRRYHELRSSREVGGLWWPPANPVLGSQYSHGPNKAPIELHAACPVFWQPYPGPKT